MCSFGDAIGQPRHRAGGHQHRALRRAHRPAHADPVRLRGQRHRHQRADPGRLDRDTFSAQPHLRYRAGRRRAGRGLGRGRRGDPLRAQLAPAGVPAPADVVRLWGHAGSDAEHAYRTAARDRGRTRPATRCCATRAGWSRPAPPSPDRARDAGRRRRASGSWPPPRRRPAGRGWSTTDEVVAPDGAVPPGRAWPSAPRRPLLPTTSAARPFGGSAPRGRPPIPNARTLAGIPNAALADELARRPELILFGEDVGRKGGVYNVTNGLQKRFGAGRVFDTLLDETSILGIAQGAAHVGLLPIARDPVPGLHPQRARPDPRRGRLASSSSAPASSATRWWCGSRASPTRRASAATSTTTTASARCATSRAGPGGPGHGATTRRACCAARSPWPLEDGRVVVFLEPIALYHERDLHDRWRRRLADRLSPAPRRTCCPARSASTSPMTTGTAGPADRQLRQRPAPVAAGPAPPAPRARDRGARARPALAEPAADRGAARARRRRRARCWWSTSAAHRRRRGRRDHRRPGRGRAPGGGLASVRAVDSFVPLGPADRRGAGRPGPGRGRVAGGGRRDGASPDDRSSAGRARLRRPRRLQRPAAWARCRPTIPRSSAPSSLRARVRPRAAARARRRDDRFDPLRHLRPANASPLIFLVTLLDAERAAADHDVDGR